MTNPTKSYLKVSYDLRPAKQVERRMILDALGRLMNAGFPIRDYQYTGLGSIYFYDFVLLYRFLGLSHFLNVEFDKDITKRLRFNKPFKPIDIRMEPVGDVIPDLSGNLKHILWLDYDDVLIHRILEDVSAAAFHLSIGSILLVTVDAEPPPGTGNPADRLAYYREQSGDYLPHDLDIESCAASRLPDTNLAIIANAILSGIAARQVEFHPLCKFVYADGHEMVTIGGVIGGDRERRLIDACDWSDASYITRAFGEPPYRITVPAFTRRERFLLDQNMPCDPGWQPSEFEVAEGTIEAYRQIHRYYPLYGELLA